MNSTMRVVLGIGVVVLAVVLFVVLGGGEDGSSGGSAATQPAAPGAGEPAVTRIEIDKNGEPVGGIADIAVNEGERVRFEVDSDVSDEVHVHGYDIAKEVEAGGSVSFDFPATIEGIFEAELEGRGEQILELRVNP